jgi:transposase InsO family protein
MIATTYIQQGHCTRKVLSILGLSASSYYHFPVTLSIKKTKGIKPSKTTFTHQGTEVDNSVIVTDIKALLAQEFVDYGYFKVYHYLKESYAINHKKVYRLMKCNKLLFSTKQVKIGTKQWVKELVPQPDVAFSYWEFDIKFMYVTGLGIYIPLLSVIDVKTRWLLGHLCQQSIKKEDVKILMEALIATYTIPQKIIVRCDNGSQFESNLIREYFIHKGVEQEFTKPATPEQNAHIESYHSILERVICRQYLFETAADQLATLKRWAMFYNYQRIHSGTSYKSPYKALQKDGIDVNKIFIKEKTENNRIFIALNEKELGNAGVQPNRDNLTD